MPSVAPLQRVLRGEGQRTPLQWENMIMARNEQQKSPRSMADWAIV